MSHGSEFTNFFVYAKSSEASRVCPSIDRQIAHINAMRALDALSIELPVALHKLALDLIPVAIDAGDLLMQRPDTLLVRKLDVPLYRSYLAPIDVSDAPLPDYATDRVHEAALLVLAEAALMNIQWLMVHWVRAFNGFLVVGPENGLRSTRIAEADMRAALERCDAAVGSAHLLGELIRGTVEQPDPTSSGSQLLVLCGAIGHLALSVSRATRAVVVMARTASLVSEGQSRLVAHTDNAGPTLDALYRAAWVLTHVSNQPMVLSGVAAFDRRILAWDVEVHNAAELVAFLVTAASAAPEAKLARLRDKAAAARTVRASKELSAAVRAVRGSGLDRNHAMDLELLFMCSAPIELDGPKPNAPDLKSFAPHGRHTNELTALGFQRQRII
jgi:hypothetical protein